MTREQAKREAAKRWGKKSYWRVGVGVSSPERRDKAMEMVGQAKEARAELEAEIKRREEAAGIPALREQMKVLSQTVRETALGHAGYYKFQVGFIDNVIGAFNVIGSGDTWEEAFAQADQRRRSA